MNTLLAHSSNYSKGRIYDIKYIVIHYTANDGDKAVSNCNYFATSGRSASAHYFVDENETWQSVPDEDTAWHCGTSSGYKHDSCRNSNSIGIEMCSRKDSTGTYYILDEVFQNTVELTKQLMKLYGIPAENVIRHYDVTGKNCPAPFVENNILYSNFKSMISEIIINDTTNENTSESTNESTSDIVYSKITRSYEYNDTRKEFQVIAQDGYNYVKVRDLAELLGKSISYEGTTQLTTITD